MSTIVPARRPERAQELCGSDQDHRPRRTTWCRHRLRNGALTGDVSAEDYQTRVKMLRTVRDQGLDPLSGVPHPAQR
ncbi:hypothetical protein [Raineyella antarctica]|uniref:hypothetical protein n=1 Tax=Raineyella antarctica TaxID=1577474 RepID=UPI0011148712|nr:hypothetical protein [Raineyella antarctica]